MKQKKILIVSSVISFIKWFNKDNVEYLRKDKGGEVHIAVNADYMEDIDVEHVMKYVEKLKADGVILHNIAFARSPFSKRNIAAYKQLKAIIKQEHFDLIHCHTPTVSMMTRLAARNARKEGSIVMYTCHGFHFHNASPTKNWMMYYPVEKVLSRYCDYLVTINKEDFHRAKTFSAKNVRYIPGVGVDIDKIAKVSIDKDEYRRAIGIAPEDVLVMSFGELIPRKNHEVIIRAVAEVRDPKVHYAIAGKGELKEYLTNLVKELELEDKVHLLGFRTDIPQLCHIADIGALPSRIEGLGLAGIETMAAGVPLVSSNVHGILDYVNDGVTGFACNPDDVHGFAKAIKTLANDSELRLNMQQACINAVKPFAIGNAQRVMWDIYDEILDGV